LKRIPNTSVTLEKVRETYEVRRAEIRGRLADFGRVWSDGTDNQLWAEMVYCFFTGGCSARMGLRSLEAVRGLLRTGTQAELAKALTGVHRYPNERARYVAESRAFLETDCNMRLRERLSGFENGEDRRDWLVREKGIKGLGYKEASHYLRNIGFRGHAILDKHVLRCLADMKIIAEPKPPNTRAAYLTIEAKLKSLTEEININFDEMDLVLWSLKTGEVLK
jgi:N-glycosylase/DNA lyase